MSTPAYRRADSEVRRCAHSGSDAERDDDTEPSGALAVKIDLDYLVLAENPDAVLLVTPTGRISIPDLMLTDMHMPGQDGLHLLQEMKARASLADVPIMVITSSAGGEQQRLAAIRLGAARFLLPAISKEGAAVAS